MLFRSSAIAHVRTAISTTETATTIEEIVSVMSTVRRRCQHEARRTVDGETMRRLRPQGREIARGNGNGIIGIASVIMSGTGT